MIERPISSDLNPKRDTVRLFFEKTEAQEFHVRAAVAWPEGADPGFAVLGGQDIKTKVIWVFEEYEFHSIAPIFRENAKAYNGFEGFLTIAWGAYSCREVFWRQPEDVHRRFALKCWDRPTIQPKPEFIKVPPAMDDTTAENLFKEMAASRMFRASKQGKLYQSIGNEDMRLPKHALICLLAGFEHFPWIDTEQVMKFHEYYL